MLHEHFSDTVKQYQWIYAENKPSGAPRKSYGHESYGLINQLIMDHHLSPYVPYRTLRQQLPMYRAIGVLMMTMGSLYQRKGIMTDRLKKATRRYTEWIYEKIGYYNRRRTLCYEDLEAEVYTMIKDGSIDSVIQNEKLSQFLYQIVCENRDFDYVTLKVQ